MNTPRLLLPILLTVLWLGALPARSESDTTQEIADRYEQLLVRSPQGGPSFDRVVDWYATKGGGLEALQKRWKEAAASDSVNRRSYLILQGLLAERLRTPAAARAFYLEAMALASEQTQAAKLLATLETTEGNFNAAANAYTKALAPDSLDPVERMELMRSLALLYQRAFDDEKALAVWRDAVKRFPNDPYVLEEAGEAFLAANDYTEARQTFTTLRDISTRDAFRRVSASLRLARTAEMEGKTAEAVEIYEAALADTSDGSWLNREVRGRIEELYRRKDDLPGLLAYYQKRMTNSPQDYQSLAAQAGVLEDLGRADEAAETLRAASKLAPQNIELRLALIRSLTGHGKINDALTEATELCQAADASPEALVMLGNLHWALFLQSKDDKDKANAITAWQRIAPADGKDTARIAQLADILATHEQMDAAIAQWQRIVTLSPDASDARQRLAEVFIKRNDKAAAAAVLDGLVAGDRASAENFLALARIQERLEMTDAARATTKKGLELFPKDYELLNFTWRQATEAKDAETVTRLFPALWLNAPNEFFAEDTVKKYTSFLETMAMDKDKAKDFSERMEKGALEPAETIVLFRLALSQQNEEVAKKALDLLKTQSSPVRAARAAYDFASTFGSPEEQVAALQAVAAADPRMASDSLRSAARIQADAGQVDDALKTLSQLIERSPADASLYTQYADVATKGGKIDDAVRRLRDAVRYVEDTTSISLQLASLLEVQGLTADATKVLQDAFEKEQRDGRRMEIFRRQIENATQSGGIDNLIATLREKQAREQGGARYGTYLAEIFMLQGDFIAAREELTRSLGKTPDNAAAVSKLIDLADRGGDQDESLRLSGKLAELEPSRENRAAYISKLFAAGELERGQAEFDRARPEILKDPTGWSGVINAMRKAGLDAQCDAMVEELAVAADSGVLPRAELARLRLMQRNYDAATKTLWQVLEAGDFSAALKAVAADTPAISQPGYPQFYLQMQPFQVLANEVMNSLQQLFMRYRGGYFSQSVRMGAGGTAAKVTPEQREQVRCLFLLAQLSDALHENDTFFPRLRNFLEERDVSRTLRILVLRFVNDADGVNELIRRQAADEKGDLETDRFIVANGMMPDPAMTDVLKVLTERIAKADPASGFEQAVSKVSSEFASKRSGGNPIDPKTREALHVQVDSLLKHPGLDKSQLGKMQIASLAAAAGDFPLAFRLADEAASEAREAKKGAGTASANRAAQIDAMRANILAQAIADRDAAAPAEFEKFLKSPPKPGQPNVFFGYYGMGLGRSMNQLLQPGQDLVAGDITFPLSAFRILCPFPAQSPQAEKVQKWFDERATAPELSPYTIGAFYADWLAGKREAALKRMEAIHEKHPSQRTAALLFEAYEKLSQPAKALAVIDAAGLQDTETMDIRSLRRIRLLRAAGQVEEAKTLAEKLARGRVSYAIRDQLSNELNLLGVPPTKYQNLAVGGMNRSRPNRDKTSQIREQINKLVADKKVDEAERIALQILQHPLPSRQDYQESNARQNMIQMLKSMGRLDRLQANLEDRLAKDPENLDLAVRLAEVQALEDGRNFADRLADFITTHPNQSNGIDYALQLLQRRGNGEKSIARVLCALIQANPDFLASTGLQVNELMNYASEPASGAMLAATIAGLKDDDYRKLFLPARLSRTMSESATLAQLAEFSVQAGQTDQAIKLLQRNLTEAKQNLDAGLPLILRLAELQLSQGKKDEAAQTMKNLFESRGSVGNFMGGGNQNITIAFANMLMNQQRQGGDIILRTARLGEQTGTLDLLLTSLDAQSKQFPMAVSPSLLIRTFLKRPEIVKEWRAIALSDTQFTGYMTLPMLTTVINVLSTQPDAEKLLPAILRKIGDNQYSMGGADYSLSCLAETLPLLAKYQSNPAVKKHISQLISKAMSDPNGSRYLVFSESYGRSINTLIQYGYLEEARRLFDFTAGERAAQNYGNRPEMQSIEARLTAAEGNGTGINIVCAALPIGPDRLRIQWKASLDLDIPNEDASSSSATWDDATIPVSKKLQPQDLEIFAGPNPAALEKIAQKSKPEMAGTIEAKVTAPIGLLQARWKTQDGSRKSGPLTAYVLGENLIVKNGVPESQVPGSNDAYKTGQPGPNGKDSAVRYESTSASQRSRVDLASLVLDDKASEIIVFAGWIQSTNRGGNMPRLETTITQDGGKTDTNSNYLQQTAPGQWRQSIRIWTMNTRMPEAQSLSKTAEKMAFRISLDASSGYNSLWVISGAWDGLQVVRIKASGDSEDSRKTLEAYRTAASKKDFAAAATAFLTALKANPYETLQQSPATIVETFKKANRLSELFTQVSAPSLLLANPLRNNQPVLQNEALIDLLAREALAPGAPPEAKAWITQISNAPLNENLRFIVQAAAFREEASRDPAKASTKDVLALLGFKAGAVNRDRIRSLWYNQRSGKPTLALLNLLNDEKKVAEARELLKPVQLSTDLIASRQMLEAWLIAPTDPQGALDLWNQTVAQRYGGQNSVNVDDETDRALILRMAQTYPTPGNLIAAVNGWLAKRNSDLDSQRRGLNEIIYAAAKSDSPHRNEYAALWADAELAALKTPGYNPSRDRIRELVNRLMDAGEWDRLNDLLAASKTSSSLGNDPIQREFAQLRDLIAFARGNLDVAWPVCWCKPGTDSREVEVFWQWNTKDIVPSDGKFDTSVSVAAKPVLPEIKGQGAVEIFFGEMPSTMQSLGKVDGAAATGSLKVSLPAANGFLRAEAILGDRKVPGPLTPVLSGKRVYPPNGTSLKALLSSGSQPLAANLLNDTGSAPDGSPAVRIGTPREGRQLGFTGADIPVVAGKFYVSRGWVRHAGNGSVVVSSEYKPVKTSTKGSLNMLLTDKPETPGPWVLYTRAMPALSQHTFWIPFKEVDTVTPRIWDAEPGTELAAWEVIEVEGWKYSDWITELANLRESAGDTPDAAAIERALTLAAIEPLTALDYHGDWLGAQLPKAGKGDQLAALYQTAFTAEANPLFSRPKYWRLFNNMTAALNAGEGSPAFSWQLAQIALANKDRCSAQQKLGFQSRALAVAPTPENRADLAKTAREELMQKLTETAYLKTVVSAPSSKNDRPVNELLLLVLALDDAEVSKVILQNLNGKGGDGIDLSDKLFATMAFEACLPGAAADDKWHGQVERAFRATENSTNPDAYMRWPAALADLLTSKKLAPDTVLQIRKAALEHVLKAQDDEKGKLTESIHAAVFLIETALAQGDATTANEAVATIVPIIKASSGKLSEESLRTILRAVKILPKEQADALVSAADADIKKSPKMSAAYGNR